MGDAPIAGAEVGKTRQNLLAGRKIGPPPRRAGAAQREVEICKSLGYLNPAALSCHSPGASVTIGRQSGCHDLLGGLKCRL